jgi:hypothetical protein
MEKVQNRDVFTYWTSLDTRFIKDIVALADGTQMDFVSFFWMRNFFYEMDYGPTIHSLTTLQLNTGMNQGAIKAVSDGSLSVLGQALQKILTDPAQK